jgi:tripartite-type tricarboxylate transporter receptor subunit TctC
MPSFVEGKAMCKTGLWQKAPIRRAKAAAKLLSLLAFVLAWAHIPHASAQTYPSRPITIVVPFAAGGPTDTIARIVGQRLQTSLGQAVIIENVSGAGGSIGVARAVHAAPDGYTLGIGHWGTHVAIGAIYPLDFDLVRDLEPIALIASSPWFVVARTTMAASNLKGLIEWLKENGAKASAATAGVGSPQHVFALFFQNATGTRFQFVPYRGAAPAMQDLVAGRVDLMIDSPANSLAQLRAGNIKAYVIAARRRTPVAPEVPTTDEAGLPGFYLSHWHALWAPKGTPKEIITKLNGAVVEALANPAVRTRLADLAQEVFPPEQQTPEALAAYQKAEIEKWWPIIKAANIKTE